MTMHKHSLFPSAQRIVLLVTALACSGALACRIVVPPWPPPPWWWPPHPPLMPPPPRPPAPMEVREHRAEIEIRQRVATVTVEALFHNPNAFRIEGTYVFPIGRDAAVSSFTMSVNGKTLEAELLDAEQARRIYEDIVRHLRDPALLEYAGEGLLKARVFPIEPHGDVRIQLGYELALKREGGLTRVLYPFLSAKPDGSQSIGKTRLEVRLETDAPLKSLFVPGFDPRIEREGSRKAKVVWERDNQVPDRDFELIFSEDKRPVGMDFLAYKDGDEGHFLLLVSPDSELQAERIPAKDVTFVVDTSGSMMGEKIRQARDALVFCIEALNPDDRFNLIPFATDVRPYADQPLPATVENRRQARDLIAGLKASGGTAIDGALQAALKAEVSKDRPSFLVLITDGLPTVGETDPTVILKRAKELCGTRRLFAFGVGYDVNTRLLDGLCQGTRGSSSYVRPNEDLEVALSTFADKIAHPVMTGIRLDSGTIRLAERNPPEMPDLFRGSELRITGTYRGSGRAEMTLAGEVMGRTETFRFVADLDGNRRNTFIPRMWAVSRVGYLQEQIRVNGRNEELVEEIRRLGRKFGILTEYTSFLIVEDNVDRARVDAARRAFRDVSTAADRVDSGALAVERSVHAKAMQSGAHGMGGPGMAPGGMPGAVGAMPRGAAAAPLLQVYEAAGIRAEEVAEMVRPVGEKTFYLRRSEGFWYDSLVPAGSTPRIDQEVTAWSAEFFDLVRRYPDLSRYLQVAEKLVLLLGGKTVRISP
jgi:Ca-activated chloride channel family protein